MKNFALSVLVGVAASFVALPPATAQQWLWENDDRRAFSYEDRDAYELFVDRRGRRLLIDRDTGEVIGFANSDRRLSRRDRVRAEGDLRRERRRQRLNRELNTLFGLNEQTQQEFGTSRGQGKFRENTPPPPREEKIARLPDPAPPVQKASPLSGIPKPKYSKQQMIELQVVLDREGFSPGAIDGQWGSNLAKAVASWKEARGSKVDLGNPATLADYVSRTGGAVLSEYTITPEDVAGPYVPKVPEDYAQKAQMKALAFTSVDEMLAEKFHMSLAYLRSLNPGKNFWRAGTTIKVVRPGAKVRRDVHYIIADKAREQLRGYDRNGKLVAAYPATIGSAATPSPTGTHSVERIAFNPEYTYNPKKNFQQGDNDKILRIPPGPNGPVGSVWIALSKPTYGIHGTPNPETIGKTNSNGCIRLTNWDAQELAKLVRKGVTVEFVE